MKSYYAFRGVIRYYAYLPKIVEVVSIDSETGTPGDLRGTLGSEQVDPSRWKEPAHIVLANIPGANARTVEAFIRRYGPLLGRRTYLRPVNGDPQFYESLQHFNSFGDLLRAAWAKRAKAEAIEKRLQFIPENFDEESGKWIGNRGKVWLSIRDNCIQANVTDLERFICLLFLRDLYEGNTAVCANPNCPAPYFIAQRKGQSFCTHKCAVLINVRKFREREAARESRSKSRRKAQ